MRLSKERLLFDSVKMRFGINRSFLLENSIWNIRVGRIGLNISKSKILENCFANAENDRFTFTIFRTILESFCSRTNLYNLSMHSGIDDF